MPRKKIAVKKKRVAKKANKVSTRKRVVKKAVVNSPANYVKATKKLIEYIVTTKDDRSIVFKKRDKAFKAFVIPKDVKFEEGARPNFLSLSVFAVDFSTGKVLKSEEEKFTNASFNF